MVWIRKYQKQLWLSQKLKIVGGTKVFDTSLIFAWVIGLQASTSDSVDIKTLLLFELEPGPTVFGLW